jgi:RNA recognition motif-containing protein
MTREIPVSNNLEKVTEPLIETPLDVVHNESTNTIDLLKKEAINETNDDIEEETCLEEGSVAPPSGEELFFIDVEPQEQYKVQLNTPEEELKKLPVGSKLFVGNLPVDYNDEDELVSIFSLYGNIYGISFVHKPRMTQAYIQFDQPASVKMSIEKEDRKVMKQGYKLGKFMFI